jgi:diacylglycerol kinase family enzyme
VPHLHIIANARSGALDHRPLLASVAERLRSLGHRVDLDHDETQPLDQRAARAASGSAEILVAAGGDGTITAVAGAAIKTGKPVAILPLGTANLLARDLAVPLDVDAWVAAFETMEQRRIDVGMVAGRPFLHKVVIGFAPAIAAGREKLRGRRGLAAGVPLLGFLVRRLFRSRRFSLEFVRDEWEVRSARVQAIAVANNAYDEAFGHFFSRSKLDAGTLSLYLVRQLRVRDAVRLALRMLLGRWEDDAALSVEQAKSVTIRGRRRRLKAMIDGEVETLFTPIRFEIQPRALTVLAPPAAVPAEAPTMPKQRLVEA